MGTQLAWQTSEPSSNPSWDAVVYPVCETFNVMRAFRNHYIKYIVTGPITSRCRGNTQSAAGIKIGVIGMSATEDTDRTQEFINNLTSEVSVTGL